MDWRSWWQRQTARLVCWDKQNQAELVVLYGIHCETLDNFAEKAYNKKYRVAIFHVIAEKFWKIIHKMERCMFFSTGGY